MQRFYEWRCKFSQKAVTAVLVLLSSLGPNQQNAEARKKYANAALGPGIPFLYAAGKPDVCFLC